MVSGESENFDGGAVPWKKRTFDTSDGQSVKGIKSMGQIE